MNMGARKNKLASDAMKPDERAGQLEIALRDLLNYVGGWDNNDPEHPAYRARMVLDGSKTVAIALPADVAAHLRIAALHSASRLNSAEYRQKLAEGAGVIEDALSAAGRPVPRNHFDV
jgi:hypothetical protein